MPSLLVRHAGFLSTVQDLGRAGHRGSGVSLGGALDSYALRVANLLVGNAESAAGIEATLGTTHLRFADDRLVAWCGGPFDFAIGTEKIPCGHPAILHPDEELQITAPAEGGRAWLAISGGIETPLILGSRATDLRSGFGGLEGRFLREGDRVPLGTSKPFRLTSSRIASWSAPNEWSNTRSRHGFLRFVRGAEWSQFEPEALTRGAFTVTTASDRMGARLEGEVIVRNNSLDLISEPVAPGTLQVPPSGQPILLLGDCQTIGGYPKIAHVITMDLPAAAQLRPGDAVRFAEVSLDQAQRLLVERERDLETFRIGLELQTGWS